MGKRGKKNAHSPRDHLHTLVRIFILFFFSFLSLIIFDIRTAISIVVSIFQHRGKNNNTVPSPLLLPSPSPMHITAQTIGGVTHARSFVPSRMKYIFRKIMLTFGPSWKLLSLGAAAVVYQRFRDADTRAQIHNG